MHSNTLLSPILVSTQLPIYDCHKQVAAVKIKKITLHDPLGDGQCDKAPGFTGGYIFPEDEKISPIPFSPEYWAKHQPKAGGYFVVYDNGYQSFSPAEAFEGGYAPTDRGPLAVARIERDNWEETARRYARNEAHYAARLDRIGLLLGDDVFFADDGSPSDSPLRGKIEEVLSRRLLRLRELEAWQQRNFRQVTDGCDTMVAAPKA